MYRIIIVFGIKEAFGKPGALTHVPKIALIPNSFHLAANLYFNIAF